MILREAFTLVEHGTCGYCSGGYCSYCGIVHSGEDRIGALVRGKELEYISSLWNKENEQDGIVQEVLYFIYWTNETITRKSYSRHEIEQG